MSWFTFLLSQLGDRRHLRFLMHRASFVSTGREAYFFNLTNLSRHREVEVTHVWLDSAPPVSGSRPDRMLPKRLLPDETWETWIYLSDVPQEARLRPSEIAFARLSSGTVLKAKWNDAVPPVGEVPGRANRQE